MTILGHFLKVVKIKTQFCIEDFITIIFVTTFFKCRRVIDKKECSGSFTLGNDGKYVCKEHKHEPMQPIECEIKIIMNEIDKTIEENPTVSIKNTYDQKEIELLKKYGPLKLVIYWPEFEKICFSSSFLAD